MKRSVGATRRLQGVAQAHFDTNFSGTYLENMLSSTTNESGRKVPRTKSKPSLINDQVEMDEYEGDDCGIFLQFAEDELKCLTNLLEPKAESARMQAQQKITWKIAQISGP